VWQATPSRPSSTSSSTTSTSGLPDIPAILPDLGIGDYTVTPLSTKTEQVSEAEALGATYSDEKVANRDIRDWHFVIENGY
jgi:hypothetical protein